MSLAEVEAHQKRHGFLQGGDALRTPGHQTRASNAAPTFKPQARRMNKTEGEYALILEAQKRAGQIRNYKFEAVKLRLADTCWYIPDFIIITKCGAIAFAEIKGGGPIRDDSVVKYKTAKESHSWARFEMWRKHEGAWRQIR